MHKDAEYLINLIRTTELDLSKAQSPEIKEMLSEKLVRLIDEYMSLDLKDRGVD